MFITVTDNCIRFDKSAVSAFKIDELKFINLWKVKDGLRMIKWVEGVESFPVTKINDQWGIYSRKAVNFIRATAKITGTRRFSITGFSNNMLLTLDEVYH
jgi:hypothetical protein